VTAPAAEKGRLRLGREPTAEATREVVREWLARQLPSAWLEAGVGRGASAVRDVRTRDEYEAWYPTFAASGMVVPTWPLDYGGLGVSIELARVIETELAPFHLGRLNPLGLNNTASALFAHGTEEQRRRFLPPIVRNEERWCQLFSEPGAGSDLASLGCRAVRDGDEWVVSGQKVWTTWAHRSEFAILLARTNGDVPKRRGITYFLIDLRQPGVEIRPLMHMGGEIDFNEVYLDGARIPDTMRVGAIDDGWRVAAATLAGERQMVAGSGSGGVDRIGGRGPDHLLTMAATSGAAADPRVRQRLMQLWSEERIRGWTNERVRARARSGQGAGPESSIGKVHNADLNMRMQMLAVELLGADALAFDARGSYARSLPSEVVGMLRSRANSIEGGTSEINRTIVAERVLGLPREPDPYRDATWNATPRN
jgi:alkylation response protein AidB-like acyl-CoA dehydrogenase